MEENKNDDEKSKKSRWRWLFGREKGENNIN